MTSQKKIAIIGAGIAGLVCATRLSRQYNITLFEKSRGVSGRTSTRYADIFEFDHAAPYFTARTDEFKQFITELLDNKIIVQWQPKIESLSLDKKPFKKLWFEPHYVGFNRMNDIAKYLSSHLTDTHTVCVGTEITTIQQHTDNQTITLTDKNNSVYEGFDSVIITAPAVQTVNLLPSQISYRQAIGDVQMSPAYCMMIGCHQIWDKQTGIFECDDEIISKIIVNSDKPNRNKAVTALVIQATADWSLSYVDADIPAMQDILLNRTLELLKLPDLKIDFITTHRWRYARTQTPIQYPFLWDNDYKIGVCSDWCAGDYDTKNPQGVENSFLSAARLSDFLLNNT